MRKSPQVAEGPAGQPRSPPRPGGGFKDSAPGVLHLGSPPAPRSQLSAGTEGRTRARAWDGAAHVLPLRLSLLSLPLKFQSLTRALLQRRLLLRGRA